MSYRYSNSFIDPGLNTLTSPSPSGSYTQYGGIWKLSAASAAQGAGTWATPPAPHLLSWGNNNNGQLGISNITNYSSPKQVGALTNWSVISAQNIAFVSIKTDGTLWSWGANNLGQLGNGNTTKYSSPKQVGALTNWLKVSCGSYHAVAIKTDGTAWVWGYNYSGQLGISTNAGVVTAGATSPVQLGALTNWSKSFCGGQNSFAIKTDGTLWAWGNNGQGQLGLGNRTNYSSPKQVGSLTNWLSIASGYYLTVGLQTNGTIWSWGQNNYGQLGLGNTTSYSSPKQVGSLTTWLNATATYGSVTAIKTDGTLWSWGYNTAGQLGIGNTTNYSSPKQIGSLTNWAVISGAGASQAAIYGIKSDGSLWAWGYNAQGQLGLGNITNYSSPKQVGSLTTWSTISISQNSTFGIAKT